VFEAPYDKLAENLNNIAIPVKSDGCQKNFFFEIEHNLCIATKIATFIYHPLILLKSC
jgi:hypothetical protein